MKGFVCGICGFVSIDGTIPENCPVCHAPKEKFAEKEDAIKLPADESNLTEAEKKHIPQIKVAKNCELIPDGCTDVNIRVGEILHPMTQEHLIMSIDFYHNKEFLSRVILSPDKCNPAAGLHLKVNNGVITAVSHCNLHGNWIKEEYL